MLSTIAEGSASTLNHDSHTPALQKLTLPMSSSIAADSVSATSKAICQ
jgi:hypothetical protein